MKKTLCQHWFLFVFGLSFVVFLASLYFQYVRGLQPCPLCIMQRVSVLIIGVLALRAVFVGFAKSRQRLLIIMGIFALLGIYFALRQLWLQSLPADRLPACLPGLDVMMRYFPMKDIFHALFWGAADCAELNWQGLGLSMPAWSLIYFSCICLGSFFNYFKARSFEFKS
jgi:protein dithiol:quinone oxidoreductase